MKNSAIKSILLNLISVVIPSITLLLIYGSDQRVQNTGGAALGQFAALSLATVFTFVGGLFSGRLLRQPYSEGPSELLTSLLTQLTDKKSSATRIG